MSASVSVSPTSEATSTLLAGLRRLRDIPMGEPYVAELLAALRDETRSSRVSIFDASPCTRQGKFDGEAPTSSHALEIHAHSGREGRVVFERAFPFDEESTVRAEILGGESLSLIHHAVVAREAERTARQLALLDRVTRAGRGVATMADMADRAARELCEAFDGVHISLHVIVGDHLDLIARRYNDGSSRLEEAPEWFRSMPLAGDSYPARAVRERKVFTRLISEMAERSRVALDHEHEHEQVVQLIFAPLYVGDVVIGTLSVAQHKAQFLNEQLRLLEGVTTRLGAEISQTRLLEDARKRSRDLELINEIGGVIAGQLDLDAVLRTAVRELGRVIEVPRVSLSLVDESRTMLKTVACTQNTYPVVLLPVDAPGMVSLAFRTGQPVIVDDTESDDRPLRPVVTALSIRSLFVVPLIANGLPIGAILLAETRQKRKFTEEEVARATAVANLISPAIANAKMFDDLRKSYEALSRAQASLVVHERLAALGELSAVIAHEVRNPLAVIFNSLGALRKLAPPTDDARVLLDIVDEEAARLNRIVADLLDFVRPYSSHPRPASLERLVRSAIDGALRSIRTDVTIDTEIICPGTELLLDETMIQQALSNLIVNAIQATPAGGRILVRSRMIESQTASGELKTRLTFEVTDEGPGIDPSDVPRLFQPFYTTKPTGTGLGLAVVRRIAEALGGGVDARCGETSGAVFMLSLPTQLS
ncbi:MAG: GAF domain-containing protein [Polyangiaceae bacterium]